MEFFEIGRIWGKGYSPALNGTDPIPLSIRPENDLNLVLDHFVLLGETTS